MQIAADGAAGVRAGGIAFGINCAEVRLRKQIAFDAPDEQVFGVGFDRAVIHFARAHAQQSDVVATHFARQFRAYFNRHFLAVQQPDATAEERNHFCSARRGLPAAEIESPGIFQKKGAFLREKHRKAREVDLPPVYFRFSKVGIDRGRELQIRREIIKDFAAHFARQDIVSGGSVVREFGCEVGANIKAASLLNVHEPFDFAGL